MDSTPKLPSLIKVDSTMYLVHGQGGVDKVFLKEYDIQQNEHFVQHVFLPYFKDIYKDLAARSEKPHLGINRLAFFEVILLS